MTDELHGGYDIASILHDMREEYWKGITEVEPEHGATLECITFVLGGETFAFETEHAAEVVRIPRLVKVPGVPSIIVGVFNLRGEITAAIDIRPLLGLPQSEIGEQGRLIVAKGGKFLTSIRTEKVLGVEPLPLDEFVPAERTAAVRSEFIMGEITVNGRLVMLLDIVKLLASTAITAG